MKQPIKRNVKKVICEKDIPKLKKVKSKNEDNSKKYGISNLEKHFAENFLDKFNVPYIYEYEASSIKRFYDFAILSKSVHYEYEEKHGIRSVKQGVQHTPIDLLIEVDGGFWHSDPRFHDDTKLTIVQKRNKRVDEIKNKWAVNNNIPILRFWEYDIKKEPKSVMNILSQYLTNDTIKTEKVKRKIKLKKNKK